MFDVVLSHEVIEHVVNDRQAIAEAARVLQRPDAGRGLRAGASSFSPRTVSTPSRRMERTGAGAIISAIFRW